MWFEILGEILEAETFATGSGIRELALEKDVRTRPMAQEKGICSRALPDGTVHAAEVHSYEAAGIGRKEFKIKKLL
jgi:hypothetical protein